MSYQTLLIKGMKDIYVDVKAGTQQGIQQERIRMAQTLLAGGLESAQVLAVTGLSKDQLPET